MKSGVKKVVLSALSLFAVAGAAHAYTTPGKSAQQSLLKTTAGCKPSTASIDLDINNVRARVMTGGDMWRNTGTNTAAYEVPKGSKKNSLFAGSCWIGGKDGTGVLKVAAQLFRTDGNDYWPGPIDRATQNITEASCSEWDRFWKVNASVVSGFRDIINSEGASSPALNDPQYDVIKQWPATGNIYAVGANGNSLPELLGSVDQYGYAPFVDANSDGKYNWKDGDYPRSFGVEGANPTQFIWWVFNDVGNAKLTTKSQSIGIEVQTSAFAYTGTDFRNDATFFNYRLINRGTTTLDSCFIATWTDADLGNPFDDYIGCDTIRGLGVLYNATPTDAPFGENSYGSRVPMVGVDFFVGPRKDYIDPVTGAKKDSLLKMASFSYFEGTNGAPELRDPNSAASFYNYMTGSTYNGLRFSNDQSKGPNSKGYGEGVVAPFVFYGDPGVSTEWSQCSCNSPLADRRFIHSSGPFRLEVGVMNDITIGVVWVDNVGGCKGGASFKKIRAADDIAQDLFNTGFKGEYGPEAPLMTIREMDNKLICYLTNPSNSNNFNERFGDPRYIDNPKYKQIASRAKSQGFADSLYKFEGYRVFQLRKANSSVYDENGNLTADAVQVFQCDVKNNVTQIVNYTKNLEVNSQIDQYNASVKVNGANAGIVHSFVLTDDAFSTGTTKSLVNYKTYYYKVIAYAYNNFAEFDPANGSTTQNNAYLEGNNGPNTSVVTVYSAMPNPMNQNGDTISDVTAYGQGVVITRIEGSGNGGLDVQLMDTAEALAVSNGSVPYPSYKAGKGPVGVKVVDPVKLVNADWRISIYGNVKTSDTALGLEDTSRWKIEQLDNSGNPVDVIYSSGGIDIPNEEILDKYGLSVTIQQVVLPGLTIENGYITSDITFETASNPWLAGIQDQTGRSFQNWIRSGQFADKIATGETAPPCGPFDDYRTDTGAAYALMMNNSTLTTSTWAPYDLAVTTIGAGCGFAPAKAGTVPGTSLYFPPTAVSAVRQSEIPNADLVFTSDRSMWTRCLVLEAGDDPLLSENGVGKLNPRSHRSWNMDIGSDGNPVYSSTAGDTAFSWFPGYAVNPLTGERLNIVFAEDSYLRKFNGADMIWNPTSDVYNLFGETIFGGKHFTYILNTKYDSCQSFYKAITNKSLFVSIPGYRQMRWVGIPTLATGHQLLSLRDGLIPTETRLRFRVNIPYRRAAQVPGQTLINNGFPVYTFTTKGLAPTDWTQKGDADDLLDKIVAVPNPYKGQALGGNTYETSRLETKIKIINLPQKASLDIYSLDGTMVRHLEKDNNDPAISWDLYNNAGLPIASGMYLIHVKAYNKDKVIRWFGAMRPLDVTNY